MNAVAAGLRSALLVVLAALAVVVPTASSAPASVEHVTGTLTDGATWIADVPSSWNGVLLLYSHGFGPPLPANAPDAETRDALLERGYALAGSSYDPNGSWWALESAVRDQFETIDAVSSDALPSEPDRVLAVGSSMGGLISALEAQQGAGIIDGALSTCGIVAGAIHLNNYQLDAGYTIAKLLLPAGQAPKLVNFANPGEGAATGAILTAAVQEAQKTPEGRARLALVFAFLNVVPSAPGVPMPPASDAAAVEAAQYASAVEFFPVLNFVEFGRFWIELSAGGNGSWTLGEDFSALVERSPYHKVVKTLYRQAGLDLKAELASLTAGADIPADPAAIASLRTTSVPNGHLDVPALNLHTALRPAGSRAARERVRRRRARGGQQQHAATGVCRPVGPLLVQPSRAGRRRRGAPRTGRPWLLGLPRRPTKAPGASQRPGSRRGGLRQVSPACTLGRQRRFRPEPERALPLMRRVPSPPGRGPAPVRVVAGRETMRR